ncbi:MAG TPA: sigma factor, partial [Planctomycetota bacterium]|nr:sigma factor [Planctomycetota bacterium]
MTPPEPDLAAHTAYLRGVARALLGAGADADDLVQDTRVAAREHPPRRAGGLRAWLGTVARNRA